MNDMTTGAVYVQTNDAGRNEVLAFGRHADGSLDSIGSYATGGRGSGAPHLPSQGSVVLSADGRLLLVANAGSDDISVFAVTPGDSSWSRRSPRAARPRGASRCTGTSPTSSTRRRPPASPDSPSRRTAGSLRSRVEPPAERARRRSGPGCLQPRRTLPRRHRARHRTRSASIRSRARLLGDLVTIPSSGATPYGFDFSPQGALIVTEAFGGAVGAAAASSYTLGTEGVSPVSRSVGNTRSEVCWAAVTPNGRFVYVTNFGDGTISSYEITESGGIELLEPVAATTVEGEKGVRDEALSRAGDFLYALDADARRIFGWTVAADGRLEAIAAVDVAPATVAGLAVS